jgi:hypothetical protein
MWNNTVIWLSSPEQAALVNAAIWASLVLSLIWMAGQSIQRWRFNVKQARRLQASARAQARLDILNSWLSAGGWYTDLQEEEYERLRAERAEVAMTHGDDYFSEYCEEAGLVEVQLDKVIYNTLKAMQ